jgi:hypothetical protein
VLDVFEISYGNFARSEHYAGEDSTFAFYSLHALRMSSIR